MARERAVVVGAGGISNAWFPPLLKEKVEVVGVVDMNPETARKQIEKYELSCEAYTDLARTLQELQPDFVCDLTIPERTAK
jgi:predicted dehydrogenase